LRAPTPTAAAEMAAAPRNEWLAALEAHADDMTRSMRRKLSDTTQTLDWMTRRLVSPAAYIARERLKLQGLKTRLGHAGQAPLAQARHALQHLQLRLAAQLPDTGIQRARVTEHARRLATRMATQVTQRRQALSALAAQLDLLNPQRTLERGYAMVIDTKGRIVRNPDELHPRQTVTMRLAEGTAEVGIASVQATLE